MPRLDHVAFRVSDIDASIAFYTERLGLTLLFSRVDRSHREAFAFLEMEGGNLELLQLLDSEGAPVPFRKCDIEPPYCPHIAIATDDLDATVVKMERNKIPILAGPLEITGSVRWLYFCDPDDHVLEYIEWAEGAEPS